MRWLKRNKCPQASLLTTSQRDWLRLEPKGAQLLPQWSSQADLLQKSENRVLSLYRMVSTQIERHIKVRGTANPYDPQDTEYFAKRRCFAWRVRGNGRTPKAVSIV